MTEPPTGSDEAGDGSDEADMSVGERVELLTEWIQQLATSQQALERHVHSLTTPTITAGPDCAAGAAGTQPNTPGAADQDGAAAGGSAPDWRRLTGDQAQQTAAELHEWVDWLTGRFRIHADLPGCWHEHTDLFEEMSALRAAHTAAYAPTAPPGDGLDWLANLDRARDRWQRWNATKCTYATHAPAGDTNLMLLPGSPTDLKW